MCHAGGQHRELQVAVQITCVMQEGIRTVNKIDATYIDMVM